MTDGDTIHGKLRAAREAHDAAHYETMRTHNRYMGALEMYQVIAQLRTGDPGVMPALTAAAVVAAGRLAGFEAEADAACKAQEAAAAAYEALSEQLSAALRAART